MNKKRIEEIIGIAVKWDLDALEVEDDAGAVRVVRRNGSVVAAGPAMHRTQDTGVASSQDAAEQPLPPGVEIVPSPMVGIFTTQPPEGRGHPVQVSDMVEPGQALGYVEAMKMVTEITAASAGELIEIQAADGQAVQFGQSLFLVQTAPGGK